MLTYLLVSRMALWVPLSSAQRRWVWAGCIHPMLIRWPVMVAKTCLLMLALLGGNWLGAYQGWPGVVLVLVAGFLLGDVIEVVLILQRRQQVSQYLHDHAAEIQSVS